MSTNFENQNLLAKPATPLQLSLRRFFHQAWVEISIGVLVIISVVLTLLEFYFESEFSLGKKVVPTMLGGFTATHMFWMITINEIITVIFAVELLLRYFGASSKSAYFREFWLDIIATLPVFRIFRTGRALRLLRLVRLLRLMGVISRLSSHYPYIIRRGVVDFSMVCLVLLLSIVFGTLGIMHFENEKPDASVVVASGNTEPNNVAGAANPAGATPPAINAESGPSQFNMRQSFWFSVYTLFAGEPVPSMPKTLSGRIVSVFLMFMGLTVFAILAGTVSAFMVDRIRVEGRIVEWDALQNHIVVCGWTPKTRTIIDEYRASPNVRKTPIVVITELSKEEIEDDLNSLVNVVFVHDDFTKVSALERAGIYNAKTCLVLTDTTGGRSGQDADARTILASLTVEKMNGEVYTCAELVNRSYATHLESGHVNDFVVSGEYGAHMLAQASLNRGLINVLSELLTNQRGNDFHRLPIPDSWIGESFDKMLKEVRRESSVILVAVHSVNEEPNVNPKNYTFRTDDQVVLISNGPPKLS